MGPVSAAIPLYISVDDTHSIAQLLDSIALQLAAIKGIEHLGMPAGSTIRDYQTGILNWNPPNTDLFSSSGREERIIPCPSTDNPTACLDFRRTLSTPPAHSWGLMLDVHEHHVGGDEWGHISIRTSWDPQLVDKRRVGELVEKFKEILRIVTGKGVGFEGRLKVGEVMAQMGAEVTEIPSLELDKIHG